jgi:hypothetical protein
LKHPAGENSLPCLAAGPPVEANRPPPSWAREGEHFRERAPSSTFHETVTGKVGIAVAPWCEEPSAHPQSSGADADEDAPGLSPCRACSAGRRMHQRTGELGAEREVDEKL